LDAERCHSGLQAGNLPVVVSTENVYDSIEPTDKEFVAVIGEISREVRRVAVRSDENPVATVSDIGRPKPDRAVPLVDEVAFSEQLDRLRDLAGLLDRGLRVPLVETDVESRERRADVVENPIARESARLDDVVGSLVFLRQPRDV